MLGHNFLISFIVVMELTAVGHNMSRTTIYLPAAAKRTPFVSASIEERNPTILDAIHYVSATGLLRLFWRLACSAEFDVIVDQHHKDVLVHPEIVLTHYRLHG